MQISRPLWERLPITESGDYWFDGRLIVTDEVRYRVSQEEIQYMYWSAKAHILAQGGQIKMQIYDHQLYDQKLYLIDNMTRTELSCQPDQWHLNYCTLMFPHEFSQLGQN